jgi:streptogramin lyase
MQKTFAKTAILLCTSLAATTSFAVEESLKTHACLVSQGDATTEALISNTIETHDDDEYFRIVLQYSILRRSDGTGGFNHLELIDEHIRHVNWGFRDTPFVFVRLPGVRYIDDDNLFNLDTINETMTMYGTYHTPGVGNIYMHNGLLFNGTIARAYTSPTFGQRGHTYGDTRIGLPANLAYSPHELGHFFHLYHPYESGVAGTECVARTNCTSRGDFVCDTPASPIVFGGNTLRTGEYFGSAPGPCVGDPAYAPLTNNWMEAGWQYGDAGALIRDNFTPGQVDRMIRNLHTRAFDLIGPDRPDFLVDCDQDGVDDIDEILAGDEADINEDKVPDQCQNFLRTGDLLVSGMTGIDTNTPRFFDPQSGAFRGSLRTGASWAHQLRHGPDGLIYMPSVSVIQQLDPVTGYLVKNLVDGGPDGAGTFVDILFDAQGNLLVLDNTRGDIKRYDRHSGSYLGQFANLPMSAPKYMEYGPDGHIFVTGNGPNDNRVLRVNAQTGAVMGDFVSQGSGGLTSGQGLVFHSDGFLYVSEGTAARVLRYDATSGAFDSEFVTSSGNGGLSNPHSLRFGPDGHLYVASRGSNSVKRFDGVNGAFMDDFVAAGSGGPQGTGTIDNPAGLLFQSRNPGPGHVSRCDCQRPANLSWLVHL